MKDHSIAYMAGLIDTDGTLGIYYRGLSGYQATLEFYNDSEVLMKWIVNTFGGTYNTKSDPRRSTIGYRWKPQSTPHLINFLDTVIPYLVLKKEEAKIIRQFLDLKGECPDTRKYLMNTCKFIKGQRSIVETDTLGSFLNIKPNLRNAYVAGLIDGDGNIDTYENQVVIGFTNMCLPLIDVLIKIYGGGKYKCKPTTWRWQIGSTAYQGHILLSILPYILLKKDKAKVALNFVRGKLENTRKLGRPYKKLMIQSELMGDYKNAVMETLQA